MAGERDQGLQALQRGDVASAIQLLETACATDPSDFQAHTYLGAAYSQTNRSMDAITVLTRAVELQPGNGQARYNLGVAMERAGYREQAIEVLEQAVMLQGDYPKAREALQRLRGASAAPAPAAPAAAPQPAQTAGPALDAPAGHAAPPAYGAPGAQPAHSAPPQYGAGAAAFGAPPHASAAPAANPYGAPTAAPPAYGAAPAAAPTLYGAQPAPYGAPQPGTYAPQAAPYGGNPYPPQPAPQGLADYGAATAPATTAMPAYGAPPSPYGAPPSPYGAQPNPYGPPPAQSPYAAQRPQTTYSPAPTPTRSSVFEGGIGMAILLGLVGGVIGTSIWVGIIMATHFSSGLIGLGVGAIVGLLIRKGMGGPSTAGGVMASVITILSSIAGNAIAMALLQATNAAPASIGFSIAGIFISYRIASS